MPPPTQANRLLSITTQPGADVLLLRSFSISEQMGRLFQIEVEMDSTNNTISFEDVIGTSATVSLTLPSGKTRYFNGIVSRFVQDQQKVQAQNEKITRYRATLSPWLWLLTRSSNCRIFQNMSVPDIVEEIFKKQGFTDYKLKLSATYNPKDYCVQYRESDFNFVSRLMEQEGIYYFFAHDNGKHTLTLADAPSQHDTFPGYDTLNYRSGKEQVSDWIIEKELQSVSYVMNDFNFVTPKADVTANANIPREHAKNNLEVFDYPGGFATSSDGEAVAKLRIQELQAQYEILRGQTKACGVATGYKFSLKGHTRTDQAGRQYLVIGESVQATAASFATGGGGGDDFFSCSFTAIPATQQFRTPRITPKPLIRGPQTAIVTGPSGQEIYTDEYGRVCVQFPWDRPGQDDNKQSGQHSSDTSCMIRVAQVWAGKQWGALYIPRIGQEVVVEFLEGDPDRPLVTGSVYNADQMPPQTLPANQTQSGIMSRSTTGGSTDTFNSIWFEDKEGSEIFTVQAQKDMSLNIKNNRTETVGGTLGLTVTGDVTETFKGNYSQTVSKDTTLTLQGKLSETVSKDVTETYQGKLSQTVTSDVTETFNAGHTEQTTNAYSLQAQTVSITGQTKVTLTVGGNSITIDSSGITLNASGPVTIKGATVAINS